MSMQLCIVKHSDHTVTMTIITIQVKVDLKALAMECVPDLNLDEELQKQLLPSPPPSPVREKFVNYFLLNGVNGGSTCTLLPYYVYIFTV